MEARLKAFITKTGDDAVSNLDDSIQRNTQAVSDAVAAATQEIQQLKDALGGSATPEQLAQIDAATQALNDATAALQADDPAAPPA